MKFIITEIYKQTHILSLDRKNIVSEWNRIESEWNRIE